MKSANTLRNVTATGTLDTSSATAMTIDPEGMRFILDTLNNQYSNGELAVVREYSCNARDAHVESGQTRPIEVSLPTPIDPQLKVQDWGIGLSKDGLIKTYAQYGASTKRDSNKLIGAFGIGSKSAFTVTDMFRVVAVKDAERTEALFSMTDAGPTVQVLSHTFSSNEPNGVLVDIGVSNVNAVRDAAATLFAAWPIGSVLVDGKAPHSLWTDVEEIAPSVYMDYSDKTFDHSDSRFKVIMGGVPYDVPQALWVELPYELRSFVDRSNRHEVMYLFDVKIGSVEITPSREELRVTPLTIATVRRELELLKNSLGPWMTQKLDEAKTIWEASRVFKMLSQRLGHELDSSVTYWNGQSLGAATVRINHPNFWVYKRGSYYAKPQTEESDYFSANINGEFNDVLFVTGVKTEQLSIVKRHSKAIIMEEGSPFKRIVASNKDGESLGWFSYGRGSDSGIVTMTYDDYRTKALAIRKANMAAKGTAGPRTKTKYEVTTPTNKYQELTADEINASGCKVLYRTKGMHVRWDSFQKSVFTGKTMVVTLTGSKKLDPLQKAVPGIKSVTDFFEAKARKIVASMTADDIALLKASAWVASSRHAGLDWLVAHKAQLTNANLLTVIASYEAAHKPSQAQQDRMEVLRNAHRFLGKETPKSDQESIVKLLKKKLPLLMIAQANSWNSERELGSRSEVGAACLAYVNSINF